MRFLSKTQILSTDTEFYAEGLSLPTFVGLLLIGILGAFQPALISFVWLLVFAIPFYAYLSNRIMWIWYCIALSPGLEILGRMSRAPFIPDEAGKYFLLIAIALLIINDLKRGGNKPLHRVGELMLLLLLPSIIVAFSVFDLDQWIFNLIGPLELSLLLFLASRERWNVELFCKAIQVSLMPLICILAYLTVKTPSFAAIDFLLVANSATTGGFGSNQVSTILGMGIAMAIVLLVLKRPLFTIRWLNYILVAWLLYRGLLSFSRGGMIAAGIAVFMLLIRGMFSSMKHFLRYMLFLVLIAGMGYWVFNEVNDITGNQLLLRYKGENGITADGSAVKNLSVISSGRSDIIRSDLEMFKEYPLFGVGPGIAKAKRPQYGVESVAAHTEFTRLLSEHGIGGMLVALLLCLFPLYWVSKQKITLWKSVSGALFILAIFSSLHSAMRTNITVVLYALAAIPIYYFKPYEENE